MSTVYWSARTHKDWLQHIVIPMSTRAHTHTHTHTSISTHDKVTQVTFTHSRHTNVISSLTSIIGLLSVHSGQWTSYCNGGSASGPDSTGELSPRCSRHQYWCSRVLVRATGATKGAEAKGGERGGQRREGE